MRSETTCERVGTVTESEATSFLTLATGLRDGLVAWLRAEHPTLGPPKGQAPDGERSKKVREEK